MGDRIEAAAHDTSGRGCPAPVRPIWRLTFLVALALAAGARIGAASPTRAQAATRLGVLEQIGGVGGDVAVDGNHAYAVVGPAIAVFDLSPRPPAMPVLVGRSERLPGLVKGLVAADGLLWASVAAGLVEDRETFDLVGIDVQRPEQPRIVVTAPGLAPERLHMAHQGLLYGGSWAGSLRAVDVRDPSAPRALAGPTVGALDVAADGGRIAVAAPERIVLYEVDATGPDPTWRELGGLDMRWASALAMQGPLIFALTDGWNGTYASVIDASNPAALAYLGSVELERNATDIAAAGSRVVVALHDSQGDVGGLETGGAAILDASDPASPRVSAYAWVPAGASGVAVAGERALLNTNQRGPYVLDLTDPARPTAAAFEAGPSQARSVAIMDGRIFVADDVDRVLAYDLSTRPVRQLLEYGLPGRYVSRLEAADGYLYVATDPGLRQGQVRVLDARRPYTLTEAAVLTFDELTLDLEVVGDHLYLANKAVLRVVDVRDPAAPREVAAIRQPRSAWALAAAGDRLYVGECGWCMLDQGDLPDGLRIYDIRDPAAPSLLADRDLDMLRLPQLMRHSLAEHRGYLYVNGRQVFDVTDASAPRPGQTLPGPPGANIVHEGRLLAAASTNDAMRLGRYDLTDPARPAPVDAATFAGEVVAHQFDLAAEGDRIYVAAGSGGLVVLGPVTTTPTATPAGAPTGAPTITPTVTQTMAPRLGRSWLPVALVGR